jgi:hypothetical protein
MVVVPLAKPAEETSVAPVSQRAEEPANWTRYAAAGTLAVSGVLLVTGRHRAGLVAAISGAALAILDQEDVVRGWWHRIPSFLDDVHNSIERAQCAVEDLSTQGEKLRQAIGK